MASGGLCPPVVLSGEKTMAAFATRSYVLTVMGLERSTANAAASLRVLWSPFPARLGTATLLPEGSLPVGQKGTVPTERGLPGDSAAPAREWLQRPCGQGLAADGARQGDDSSRAEGVASGEAAQAGGGVGSGLPGRGIIERGRGKGMSANVLQGDVFSVLPTLAKGLIDCVITSPPYWKLRDYSVCPCVKNGKKKPGCTNCDGNGKMPEVRDRQLGMEDTPDEYIANMVRVFSLVREAMAEHAVAFVNIGDTYSSGSS